LQCESEEKQGGPCTFLLAEPANHKHTGKQIKLEPTKPLCQQIKLEPTKPLCKQIKLEPTNSLGNQIK
jgi:hypothetical protein